MNYEIRKLELNMGWQDSNHIGSLIDRHNKVTAALVTTTGDRYPISIGEWFKSEYAYEGGMSNPGQTVEDAWLLMGKPEIARVEVTEKGHDDVSGRDHDEWDRVIWYVPEGRIELGKLELIEWGAKALLGKEIGFSEFKRIIRENS